MSMRIIAVALLLSGCASLGDYDGHEWTKSSRPALPYTWLATSQEGVAMSCHHAPGRTSYACAIYAPGLCTIVAEADEAHTPAWLADHEKRHCAGWDHE